MIKKALVTGGAGYIGSAVCHHLLDKGIQPIVIDNLSTGFLAAVPKGALFFKGDMADKALVSDIVKSHKIDTLLHFAADMDIEKSIQLPAQYYLNNFCHTLNLITTCVDNGVEKVIFSSTCAVYGSPKSLLIDETTPCQPINPYGRSKLAAEWMIEDLARSNGKFRFVILRYFNVAGAHPDRLYGQRYPKSTHLIKVASRAALGILPSMKVFGTDYPTPDGSCIRDYIHIDDLASAHLSALDYLHAGQPSVRLNCGYGRGYSVLEVIKAMKSVSGRDFTVELARRREGDPAHLVASTNKIQQTLSWTPQQISLEKICQTALEWEEYLLNSRTNPQPAEVSQ